MEIWAASQLAPDQRDLCVLTIKIGMLRNILSPQVPQIAGDAVAKLFSESLAVAKIKREEITGWILHTGGRDVILSYCEKLKINRTRRSPQLHRAARIWQRQQPDGFLRARTRCATSCPTAFGGCPSFRRGLQLPRRIFGSGGGWGGGGGGGGAASD